MQKHEVVAGKICNLPDKDKIDSALAERCRSIGVELFNHPVVVLHVGGGGETGTDEVIFLIIRSFNGKGLDERVRNPSRRRRYLPIHPSPAHAEAKNVTLYLSPKKAQMPCRSWVDAANPQRADWRILQPFWIRGRQVRLTKPSRADVRQYMVDFRARAGAGEIADAVVVEDGHGKGVGVSGGIAGPFAPYASSLTNTDTDTASKFTHVLQRLQHHQLFDSNTEHTSPPQPVGPDDQVFAYTSTFISVQICTIHYTLTPSHLSPASIPTSTAPPEPRGIVQSHIHARYIPRTDIHRDSHDPRGYATRSRDEIPPTLLPLQLQDIVRKGPVTPDNTHDERANDVACTIPAVTRWQPTRFHLLVLLLPALGGHRSVLALVLVLVEQRHDSSKLNE
ncbi:hypothetical protein AYO20_11343 [Fonsecaea nubica]|uniref:Uncharacterized protein n=1 Tax=Fonsecaea nubica TaxID=856822 RepID=A0A178BXL6_9EURO|nr:hypothetical protein AYO20_11343 [Fonsecaea nubica]OAL21625.1 hypothetical protein AYO20_11343 [Fonsecaea nubica]